MDVGSKIKDLHIELWPWFDPGSRLYFMNLLVAMVVTLGFFLFFQKKQIRVLFSRTYLKSSFNSYWLHPSALVDYKIYLINGFIKVFLFAPVLGASFYISKYTIRSLFFILPDYSPVSGNGLMFLFATVFAFLWDDFLRFFHHYWMHNISFLWQLHKTHHSAEILTPITLFRIHPLESLMSAFRNSLSFGVSAGLFMFIFSGQVEFVTLLGVNALGFLFNISTGNLRHSALPISFGFLEHIFISPKQHQIHHSNQVKHFNKNFGVALSIWDKIFGTFLKSKDENPESFGVEGLDGKSLKAQFLRLG